MDDQELLPSSQARELRARREEVQRLERERCGEAEYARRNEAMAAVICVLIDKARTLVEEARKRGFVYFACHLDLSTRNTPICLMFADGQGIYYQRSVGIKQLSLNHGLVPTLAHEMQSYALNYEGIKAMSRGMTARRARVDEHLLAGAVLLP